MRVVIIGLGYSGSRFKRAFEVCGINNIYAIKRGEDIKTALAEIKPDIVIVSTTDLRHYQVLLELNDYTGFVICEKPLVTQYDNLQNISAAIANKSGFCLNLIERYSEVTTIMKNYVDEKKLNLIRANFQWGKDRLNDKRNTCGVISEIIHGLDLIRHICNPSADYSIRNVSGCTSDFSISGNEVLDSVLLTAMLGDTPITSYSSFVNIIRRREIDLTFLNEHNEIIYANLVYDTPEWDNDHLKIWKPTAYGDEVILQFSTQVDNDERLNTIRKLVVLVNDVINFVKYKLEPSQPFPSREAAFNLQRLLNEISFNAEVVGPVKYNIGNRVFFNECGDLEKLG